MNLSATENKWFVYATRILGIAVAATLCTCVYQFYYLSHFGVPGEYVQLSPRGPGVFIFLLAIATIFVLAEIPSQLRMTRESPLSKAPMTLALGLCFGAVLVSGIAGHLYATHQSNFLMPMGNDNRPCVVLHMNNNDYLCAGIDTPRRMVTGDFRISKLDGTNFRIESLGRLHTAS